MPILMIHTFLMLMLTNLLNQKSQVLHPLHVMLILLFLQDLKSLFLVVEEPKEKFLGIFMLLIQSQWHGSKVHKVLALLQQDMDTQLYSLHKLKSLFLEEQMASNTLTIFMSLICKSWLGVNRNVKAPCHLQDMVIQPFKSEQIW